MDQKPQSQQSSAPKTGETPGTSSGLSKREQFALDIVCAYVQQRGINLSDGGIQDCIKLADRTLAALDSKK